MSDWNSTTLPESDFDELGYPAYQKVLVTREKNDKVFTAVWTCKALKSFSYSKVFGFYGDSGVLLKDVRAWMPAPEPYKSVDTKLPRSFVWTP